MRLASPSFQLTCVLSLMATLWGAAAWGADAEKSERPQGPSEVFKSASASVVVVEAALSSGTSQGSGVVVAKGEVVTNFHVIKGSRGLVTIKQGDRTWRAEVSGVDEANDLARLTILLRKHEAFDLPVALLRQSRALKVGERVYAIGAPRGLEHTLTEGLISGLPSVKGHLLVQTSAAISSGSSGGGLFDVQGQLVGITTMYLRDSQNLNFAIPSDRVGWLLNRPYEPQASNGLWQEASASPSGMASADALKVPLALAHVRTIYLLASAEGPIANEGNLTNAWLLSRVSHRLRRAGFKVLTEESELRDSDSYVVLAQVKLQSLEVSGRGIYPWMITLELGDITPVSDQTNHFVTLWSSNWYGYGGSKVVIDQVSNSVTELADQLALALLSARQQP